MTEPLSYRVCDECFYHLCLSCRSFSEENEAIRNTKHQELADTMLEHLVMCDCGKDDDPTDAEVDDRASKLGLS